MLLDTVLSYMEQGFEWATSSGIAQSYEGSELADRIVGVATVAFVGYKIGQTYFKSNPRTKFSSLALTSYLSSLTYWVFEGSLALHCGESSSQICTALSYSKPLLICSLALSSIQLKNRFVSHIVATWSVNGKVINVSKVKDRLEIQVFNPNTRRVKVWDLGKDSTQQKQIDYLQSCDVVLESNDSCIFTRPFCRETLRNTGSIDDVCTLIQGETGVFWQYHTTVWKYGGKTRFTKQTPLPGIFVDGGGYWDAWDSKKEIEEFREKAFVGKVSKDECLEFLENYRVKDFRSLLGEKNDKKDDGLDFYTRQRLKMMITGSTSGKVDWLVRVSPIFKNSHFSKFSQVTPRRWGVTLISAPRRDTGDFGNHAQIIIEGIKNRAYFMKLAHLRRAKEEEVESLLNRGVVRLVDMTGNNIEYSKRTKCFIVKRQKAEEMLTSIKRDEKKPPRLNIFGSHSVFAKNGEESCFTWARDKMKIADIDLGSSLLDCFISVTENYTEFY